MHITGLAHRVISSINHGKKLHDLGGLKIHHEQRQPALATIDFTPDSGNQHQREQTDAEQEQRFLARIHDPLKQWKLSPMDLESRARWEDYTVAKEIMLQRTSIPEAPWWVVPAVDKKKARLNCLNHLISPGSVKSKLEMRDHNSEITPEAAKEIKHSEKG